MYSAVLQSYFTREKQTPEHKKTNDKKNEKAYKNNTQKHWLQSINSKVEKVS